MALTTLETSNIPNVCNSDSESASPSKTIDLVTVACVDSTSRNDSLTVAPVITLLPSPSKVKVDLVGTADLTASPVVTPDITIVDTLSILESCISQLASSKSIAADLEGINLSRNGRVCIIQLFAEGSNTVWLVDVTTLGAEAFNHTNEDGHSLKTILESPDIMKLFFDVRCDADALFNLFGVDMKNVFDVQLLDIAYRRRKKVKKHGQYLSGLRKCVDTYLSMPPEWCAVKSEGRRLFSPELGGSFDIFERRPLDEKLVQYCAQDATILFLLRDKLQTMMGDGYNLKGWDARIKSASSERVDYSKSAVVKGHLDKNQPDEGQPDKEQLDIEQPLEGQPDEKQPEGQPDKVQSDEKQLEEVNLDSKEQLNTEQPKGQPDIEEQPDRKQADNRQPVKGRPVKQRKDRFWIIAPMF